MLMRANADPDRQDRKKTMAKTLNKQSRVGPQGRMSGKERVGEGVGRRAKNARLLPGVVREPSWPTRSVLSER